jgi:hypothetical protein
MKPENQDEEEIRSALQDAFPPPEAELGRDLWPVMLHRLQATPAKVPWYDWALAGGLAGVLACFPKLFLMFVYHL